MTRSTWYSNGFQTIFKFLLLISVLLCRPVLSQNDLPEAPPQQWYIAVPTFNSSRLDLFLTYQVSNYIPYENLGITIYDSRECQVGGNDITDNDYITAELEELNVGSVPGEGDGWYRYRMTLTFDPDNIRGAPILHEDGLSTQLRFCVKLGAYSAATNNPAAVEIFGKQTPLTVNIMQEGDFGVDEVVVDTGDILDEQATQLYKLEGWLCNETNHRVYDPIPIFQGTPTRVCVTPDAEARAAGVYMRAIDSFFWTRDTIYQTAIIPHQKAAPLTEIECEPGMLICAFTTLLKADFFFKRGQVDGAGFGWLQFGRGDYTGNARRAEIVMLNDEESLGLPAQNGIGISSPRQVTNPSHSIALFQDESALGLEGLGGIGAPSTRQAPALRQIDGSEGRGSAGFAGDGPFYVNIPVTRLYNAIGWLCDQDNNELDPLMNPLKMGDKARVCVTPNGVAQLDDVHIRSIDSYTWHRQDTNVTQIAITSNAKAEPKTEIFCRRGSLVCAFETELNDGFYGTPGRIDGTGIVWLQFGTESRRLQFDLGFALLPYMEPDFAGATPFSAHVYTIPPPELRELYTCRAYECDYDNREIVTNDAKTQGTSVRMCVAPSYPAVQAGAKMWSVEWWTWTQVNVNQTAVAPQGLEAADGRTLLMCERGMDVCMFQTRLIDQFFQLQTNGINGDGHCWITFGGFLMQGAIEPPKEPIDPSRDALFAGRNDIAIFFPVTGNYVEDLSCPPEVHSLKLFWENEDPTMKMLYLAAVVGAGTGVCCLFALCFFCNRRRDEEYIEETKGGGAGPIVVNVDIEDVHHTENNVHRHHDEQRNYNISSTNKDDTRSVSKSGRSDFEASRRSASTNDLTKDSRSRSSRDSSRKSGSSRDLMAVKMGSFSGKRSIRDVCFEDATHPGTRDCNKAVRSYIQKNPNASYSPDVYKAIRKQMGNRHFLARADPNSKWREATKPEAVCAVGKMWRENKYNG